MRRFTHNSITAQLGLCISNFLLISLSERKQMLIIYQNVELFLQVNRTHYLVGCRFIWNGHRKKVKHLAINIFNKTISLFYINKWRQYWQLYCSLKSLCLLLIYNHGSPGKCAVIRHINIQRNVNAADIFQLLLKAQFLASLLVHIHGLIKSC